MHQRKLALSVNIKHYAKSQALDHKSLVEQSPDAINCVIKVKADHKNAIFNTYCFSIHTIYTMKRGIDMQQHNKTETQLIEGRSLFSNVKKPQKSRKWREIEEFKARQKLFQELQEIDYSFNGSLNDLIY
jgi:hypothetical protein